MKTSFLQIKYDTLYLIGYLEPNLILELFNKCKPNSISKNLGDIATSNTLREELDKAMNPKENMASGILEFPT